MMNKKGFALPDVLLAVVAIGIITSSLLVFFQNLQSEEFSPQNLAMELGHLHNQLSILNPASTDVDSTGTALTTKSDLFIAFPGIFDAAKNRIENFGVTVVRYNWDKGLFLQIPKNHKIINCPSLLRYKMGFSEVSAGISSSPTFVKLSSLDRNSRITECDKNTTTLHWLYLK
jgi:hypothetical protein